jgi:two-component system copper resistance phosphate regulon response regulator CusR
MKILLVEDNHDIRETLRENLESELFTVDCVNNGESGSYMARTNYYDLIVMDYMMPRRNGLQVCKEIREAGKSAPIIMISVCDKVPEKVALLEAGADDFLQKPFSFSELLARIRAVTRRPSQFNSSTLSIDDIDLDINRQSVTRNGKRVYLTRKEFMLLECFARNRGRVVSRGYISESVWENDTNPFSNTIEAHVRNLRKKLDGGRNTLIRTVPGRGYIVE